MRTQIGTRVARLLGLPLVLGVTAALAVCGASSGVTAGARVAAHAVPPSDPRVTARSLLAGDDSSGASISSDGRFVAFVSTASVLVSGDTNGATDVFVRDRRHRVTRRVSVGAHGHQANGASTGASISANGRYVAFLSDASNLVPGDTNGATDVFVRDRKHHVTRRVSVGRHGRQVTKASAMASISADGRYVVFVSHASNLVPVDTNGQYDVFVRNLVRHVTRLVSVSSSARQGHRFSLEPSISADGRYVAFISMAPELVAGDTNNTEDAFVRDRVRHVTRRVSVTSLGQQANNPTYQTAISADGRFVAMTTYARLVPGDDDSNQDVYLRDRKSHVTVRVTASSGAQPDRYDSGSAAVSAHGRYVAFDSIAPDLVAGDTNNRGDVFVWDRQTEITELASVSTDGLQGDDPSTDPSISADGRFVAFGSEAANLVPADTDGTSDIFVRDRTNEVTVMISRGAQAR